MTALLASLGGHVYSVDIVRGIHAHGGGQARRARHFAT